MSSSSGNFSGSCGHMCNKQTCVLRTSLSLYNFGKRFLGCNHYKVGPKCPFFVWVDNPTCHRGNETALLAIEKMSRLQSALQLANEREMTALETVEKARQCMCDCCIWVPTHVFVFVLDLGFQSLFKCELIV